MCGAGQHGEGRALSQPHVVIVGGGFGGLTAARWLRRAPVRVTLVDRENHHLFQPLLYQVATAMLSPADIASPIRHVLRRQRNARVILAEVTGVDPSRRVVALDEGELEYDFLVLATGATHSYFGHADWPTHAPGLKTIDDALEIRRRFMLAFERAERQEDGAARRAMLTFVVVGAGPTGVELAGAMIEIARRVIPRDFRVIDTSSARVILFEAQDRVLPAFPAAISVRALRDLKRMGIEVRLGETVTRIDDQGVSIGPERIGAGNVIWAAGVQGSPTGASLGVPMDDNGRVRVEPDLSIPGYGEVFVIGDLAHVLDERSGGTVPGMAPGAIQMGRHVARTIASRAHGGTDTRAFRFVDKGMLATIGRGRAVAAIGGRCIGGWPAWVLWAFVHVLFLIGFRNRLAVMAQWAWAYVTYQRGARLITGGPKGREGT
ncbi:MAG: NAD(P)/FAD-dependent oxidoreductase [Planctomycetes bacterium]|nr:NAD(P)/FAD-dependent oxidoreductase [Planctomycetota bacterium]